MVYVMKSTSGCGLALHQGNRDQHVTVLGPSQLGHALSTVCGGEGNGEEGGGLGTPQFCGKCQDSW